MSPGGSPRLAVFSGVTQGPHQSQPYPASSSTVVAPLMNAHSSPIGLRQNDRMLRSVITGNPLASSKRMVCCISVMAEGPCRVADFSPWSTILASRSRYCESGTRCSYGMYCTTAEPTRWPASGAGADTDDRPGSDPTPAPGRYRYRRVRPATYMSPSAMLTSRPLLLPLI